MTTLTTAHIIEAASRIPWLMRDAADESLSELQREEADAELGRLLDGLAEGSENKLDALRSVTLRLDAEETMLKKEAARLTAKAKATANGKKRVKELATKLLESRKAAGMTGKVRTQQASYWLAESVSVEINVPPHQLHPRCVDVIPLQYKANKKAIKDLLKTGEHVEGCALVTTARAQWR